MWLFDGLKFFYVFYDFCLKNLAIRVSLSERVSFRAVVVTELKEGVPCNQIGQLLIVYLDNFLQK